VRPAGRRLAAATGRPDGHDGLLVTGDGQQTTACWQRGSRREAAQQQSAVAQGRAAYHRALSACLIGRGYTGQ